MRGAISLYPEMWGKWNRHQQTFNKHFPTPYAKKSHSKYKNLHSSINLTPPRKRILIIRFENLREKEKFISRLNPPAQSTLSTTLHPPLKRRKTSSPRNRLEKQCNGGGRIDTGDRYEIPIAITRGWLLRGGIWLSIYYSPKPDHFEMLNDELFSTRWQP